MVLGPPRGRDCALALVLGAQRRAVLGVALTALDAQQHEVVQEQKRPARVHLVRANVQPPEAVTGPCQNQRRAAAALQRLADGVKALGYSRSSAGGLQSKSGRYVAMLRSPA